MLSHIFERGIKITKRKQPLKTLLPPDFIVSVCSVFVNSCQLLDVMLSLVVIILFLVCSCYCNAAILRIEVVHFALNK